VYTWALNPGRHTLQARSSTEATIDQTFNLPEGATRWAVLDYWYYPGDSPRSFTFEVHDEPVGFA
jgi:hypothetical protein